MTERTFQLRHYTTAADAFDEFVEWWERSMPPLREQFGFTIESAYCIPERREFLWVVSHPGDKAAFLAAEQLYQHSRERAELFAGAPDWVDSMDVTFVDARVTGVSQQ